MITRISVALALSSVVGCVSKGRYDELEDQYGDLQNKNAMLRLDNEALETRLQGVRVDKAVLEADLATLEAENAELSSYYRDLLERFGAQLESGQMSIVVYPDRVSLALSEDLTFETGAATLSPEGEANLSEMATLLGFYDDERGIAVEGHTDRRPIDNERYRNNWELGAARSVTVVDELVAGGVDADALTVVSYGATAPLVSSGTPEAMAINRRVEIAMVPSLDEMAGHRELVERARKVSFAARDGE